MLISNFKKISYIHIFSFFKIGSIFTNSSTFFLLSRKFTSLYLIFYFFFNLYYIKIIILIFKNLKYYKKHFFHQITYKLKLNYIYQYVIILNKKFLLSNLNFWHTIKFKINFRLINNDLRLLNREFIYFISSFSKILNFIKEILFVTKQKKISLLRSPFIYNKSYEQFKLVKFIINIKSIYQFNLILFWYFIKWNFIIFKYSLLKINKIITVC